MGGELVVAMYTVLLGDEWDTRLPSTLKRRLLTYNYTVPQRFEYDLDIVQKQVDSRRARCFDANSALAFSSFAVGSTVRLTFTRMAIINYLANGFPRRAVVDC